LDRLCRRTILNAAYKRDPKKAELAITGLWLVINVKSPVATGKADQAGTLSKFTFQNPSRPVPGVQFAITVTVTVPAHPDESTYLCLASLGLQPALKLPVTVTPSESSEV
jgi:hypothetical protein